MLHIFLALLNEEEREIFTVLWEKYSLKLLKRINNKVLNMESAQDLVGDTFISLMSHYERYSELTDEQLKAMLITISDHITINYLKKHSRIHIISKESFDDQYDIDELDLVEADFNVEDVVLSEIKIKKIEEIINNLDDKYSNILKMKLFVGLSYNEIAEMLSLTTDVVRKRFERGRKQIIIEMEREKIW